jgi:hypothetical protein
MGTRGWWYEAYEHGGASWERTKITTLECPRISAEFLEEERREMGEWWYMQEYFGVFMDAQSAAFRSEDIARAFAEEIEVWSL